jgi:hypothetical protein
MGLRNQEANMKEIIGYASAAAVIVALAIPAAPAQAENGRNAAAAIGFGAGAAVGAAAASSHSYYGGPAYHDTYADTYAYEAPVGECRTIVRHRINRFGERVTVRERSCD